MRPLRANASSQVDSDDRGPRVRRILIMGQVFALLGGLVGAFACYLYHQDRRGILWTGTWLFVLV